MKYRTFMLWLGMMCLACACEKGRGPQIEDATRIIGQVADAEGHRYYGATITAKNGSTVLQTTTDENGQFSFEALPVGTYQLNVGFLLASEPIAEQRVVLTDEAPLQVDFEVRPKTISGALIYGSKDPHGELRNEEGATPQEPDETLYARNVFDNRDQLYKVRAADGHHLELQEWDKAAGTVRAWCDGRSTQYEIELSGLVPNGAYDLWLSKLNGVVPSVAGFSLDQVLGSNALGTPAVNKFVAGADGSFATSINMTGTTAFSSGAEIFDCTLAQEQGIYIFVMYHIDGKNHGSTPGPDEDNITHFQFLL